MSWQERTSPLVIGDPVRFSAGWLRAIRATGGDLPRMRGIVTGLEQVGTTTVATVDWQDGLAPMKLPAHSLCRVAARGAGRE
jgi:hypothetical protein